MKKTGVQGRYRFELIRDDHDVSRFDCAHQVLNVFLRQSALAETQQDLSRTYLLFDTNPADAPALCGYLTVTADSIYTELAAGKEPYLYPLVCIQFLARDRQFKGAGIGSLLLLQALRQAVAAAEIIGIAGVHLIATLEGRRLYEGHGFGKHPYGGNNLLLSIADARAIVAAAS